ncbi:MAG: hypothetical protein ACREPI_11285, partial [Candidatus Dormibacterales bacterium]
AASVRVLWILVRETSRGRRVAGRMLAVTIDPGGEDAASAARRALQDLAVSATPDTFSAGIDRERGVILVHELPRRGGGPGLALRL